MSTSRGRLTVAAAAAAALAFVGAAHAATITVTTEADELNPNGDCSLREAVVAANTNAAVDGCPAGSASVSDTIKVPAGYYRLSITGEDATGRQGDLDLTDHVTIAGAGAGSTVIDAHGFGDRIFDVRGVTAVIKGLTLEHGNPAGGGGAIMNGGTLNVSGDLLLDNTAGSGGAIDNVGVLRVTATSLYGNTATSPLAYLGSGGGIENEAVGVLTVQKSRINGNTAGVKGGGIANENASGTVFSSTISGNSASSGGGVYTNGALTLSSGSTIANNSASLGGGIYASNQAAATQITNVTLRGNSASANGGGLYTDVVGAAGISVTAATISGNTGTSGASNGGGVMNEKHGGTGTLTIQSSTISGNSAVRGKGIYNDQTLTLKNDTIAGNTGPAGRGGGLYNATGQSATLTNVTISDNVGGSSASSGGNIFNAGTLTWSNSLVARAQSGDNCGGVALVSGGHNLEDDTTASTCGTSADARNIVGDPLLGTLAANGGPTATEAIAATSPARDQGAGCLTTDQRGVPRPQGSACDIGAYEFALCLGVVVDVVGTSGNDNLVGTAGNDGILGLAGNDTISALAGNDAICPGGGTDTVNAGDGDDKLALLDGSQDRADGGTGTDVVTSHDSTDVLTNVETVH